MFPVTNGLKQGDALSPLLFNFGLEYAIRRLRVNLGGLKLSDYTSFRFMLLMNILEGSVHTVQENADALVVASKETGLELIAD